MKVGRLAMGSRYDWNTIATTTRMRSECLVAYDFTNFV
jgi:hypothetical protein